MYIQTERLILRSQKKEDIEFLVKLWLNPMVTEFMGGPREENFLREEFGRVSENPDKEKYDLWPLDEIVTKKLVGYCGLLEKIVQEKTEIELNYVLDNNYWGKGYAKEIGRELIDYGFKEMKLERIIALIDPQNKASEYVAAGIGMKFEKTIERDGGHKRKIYSKEK